MSHIVEVCPELSGQVDVPKGMKEETQKDMGQHKPFRDGTGGWEIPRKRSVKKALHMTDFENNEMELS